MVPIKEYLGNKWRGLRGSQLLGAMILLVVLNMVMLAWQPFAKVDPDSLPAAHTWVWWATKELNEQKEAPDVVLMGSSFMMHPVALCDADYLNKEFDYVHHHYSSYMSETLKKKLNLPVGQCFNFALPGGMVSDDYIVTRALFTGSKKPKVLVIGTSLRDVMDTHVKCAASTQPFRYLKRFTDIEDLVDLSMPQIWQRLDYWQGKFVYLWGKKLDMQVVACENARNFLKPLVGKFCQTSPLNTIDMTRNAPMNLRADAEEGLYMVRPQMAHKFLDNTQEYKSRYKTGNDWLMRNQVQWFNKLLKLAKDEGIEVLLVNMPMTPENMQLMPPGNYDKYMDSLREISSKWHLKLVDLNGGTGFGTMFARQDFQDTAHMNGLGGKKLIDVIASTISANRNLASAFGSSPQLAGVQARSPIR